jgi:hypothetical protein
MGPGGKLVFEASVPLSESRTASYDGFQIIHLPTSLLAYKNTSGRTFSVQGKLVSRTEGEAAANSKNLDLVRTWILPDFGGTGATPPILKIKAYDNVNIDNKNVVLKAYTWSFPDDVDYIYTGDQKWPIIGMLNVEVEEVYSAEEITAGKWKLTVGGGGDFVPGDREPSSSFTTSFGGAKKVGGGSTSGGSLPSVTAIASALDGGGAPTPAANLLGALAKNSALAALNSPELQEATKQLSPIAKNIFISGANVAINQAQSLVSQVVTEATSSFDGSFGRDILSSPTIISDD